MNTKEFSRITKAAGGTWGIILRHLNGAVLFEHNADTIFSAASVGKIPVALYVLHLVDTKRAKLGDVLKMEKKDYVGGSGVLRYLKPPLKLRVEDLLKLMLISSDNIAARLLVCTY